MTRKAKGAFLLPESLVRIRAKGAAVCHRDTKGQHCDQRRFVAINVPDQGATME